MKLNLKDIQSQNLIMTPELTQAIKILQYTAHELTDYINEALLDNPLLEKAAINSQETLSYEVMREKELSAVLMSQHDAIEGKSSVFMYETLTDYLQAQLNYQTSDKLVQKLGNYIIANIDGNGYLKMDMGASIQHLKTSYEQLESVIQMIQTFEPAGVGARTLKECLLLQLNRLDPSYPLKQVLIEDYLEALSTDQLSMIAKKLNRDVSDIHSAYEYIKKLDPKPGRSYSKKTTAVYIRPDVIIQKTKDSKSFTVKVNLSGIPSLSLNTYYQSLLLNETLDDTTREYLTKKLQAAKWLIQAITQRNENILKICNVIVEAQKDFLTDGFGGLKPLTMKSVALAASVHESTVSRAVSGKYAKCPEGTYSLKFFFQSGLINDEGELIASENIKHQILKLIAEEDKSKPFSDQKIADALPVGIARRTVTKYREQLGIPSSSRRKRLLR